MTTNIKMFKLKISRKQNTIHKAGKRNMKGAGQKNELQGTRKMGGTMREAA